MEGAKISRPPIVVVLGHVDHGKTSLLDAIRKTSVAAREAGGITQSIGASVVEVKDGKKITFIDTPGHAAFSKMRSRGAKVADIAVLVVAAEDGVKPQTLEAVSAIREANIPFIVAITKIDLPSADPESLKGQLEREGVTLEGRGGDTPAVPLSSKTGVGVSDLLETILLLSEVNEIKADPKGVLEATVIETSKDKKGQVASVIVRDGTLIVGDLIQGDGVSCKVRALFNDKGESVREIFPGYPCQILGFERLPPVGSQISQGGEKALQSEILSHERKVQEGEISVILKAQSAGALEALVASIPSGVVPISFSVGDVNESDVLSAKASGAYIFVFESKIPSTVGKLADTEAVTIERFEIIYELVERLEEIIKKGKTEVSGKAEILAIFPFDKSKVAGCKALEGKITKADDLILFRDKKEVGRAKISSMKRGKTEIVEAKAGEEFGVLLNQELDFKIGDVLVSVAK